MVTSFGDLLEKMGIPEFNPFPQDHNIRIFIEDMHHAIPYYILENKDLDIECKFNILTFKSSNLF